MHVRIVCILPSAASPIPSQFLMDAQRKLHAKVEVDVAFEDVKSVLHID
jgi:hypothetical protein